MTIVAATENGKTMFLSTFVKWVQLFSFGVDMTALQNQEGA